MRAQYQIAIGVLLTFVSFFPSKPAQATPSFQQVGNILVMSNAAVTLDYNLNAGTTDFYWQNSKKISAFYSGVTLSTGYIKGINYSSWSYAVISSNEVVVTATGSGLPVMQQHFTLDQNDSFLVRVDMVGTNLSANWMGPVVVDSTGWVNIGITNDNCALVVPFDDDGFVTYNAMPMNSSGNGYEVGAFYDNTSRNGLVVGSVTHDTWKTGIFFSGANNELALLNVYGGAMDPWDVMPHGSVVGNVISSPTIFVGFGADWRVTMQNFAAENTNFAPSLAWTNGVPFGWNSWGVIQQNISYADAIAVSDYFYVNLIGNNFNDNGTVYINLDSYWNNLSGSQLQSFVSHCHAHGEKTGIYFGPFVYFGTAAQGSNTLVTGSSTYYWSDAYLRTTNGGVQTVDGGIALDPTHPGTQQMINYYINQFTNWGFDYIKLDFLSHGALEGVHYDTNVTTGIEAYNQGMQYVLNQIDGRMFISESISPLFPYQYGDSRRIACDAEASLIANTEYTMNSVSYGWWLDNLYQFNDPDIMVFNGYGATTNENQSRLISGAVTGLFLDGDALTNSSAQSNVQELLTNQAIDNVARVGQTFTPVEGNTGTSAVNIFARQDGATWCIAVFNYTSSATNETVNLSRAGLPSGSYNATNLWDGTATVASGSFNVNLNAKQSKLFQLTAVAPANLRWSASNNDGVWDTGISTNWINLANSQQTVFNTGNQVLFDDTVGVPASVTVNGTVSPGLVTVNSSTNNYTFSGSGSISGVGSLVKEGSSTLTIVCPANFTGPVTISGGTIYAGDFSFTDVSSITITNNSTLDFGGGSYTLPVTVSGAGVNGEGAIYNSYSDYPLEDLNITLAGATTFGGSQRWDLYEGSISGPYNVTISWSNSGGYGEWNTATIATNVGNIELATGALGIKSMGTSFGNPASTFTVDSGTELDFWTGDPGYAKIFHVLTNGLFQFLTGFTTFNGNFTLENGANLDAFYGSGNQTMNGSFTLNGIAHFMLDDANFIFTNVMSGTGGFVWDAYNHQMILQAANTYSGPTVIGGGLTLALSGNGSISDSSLIFLGGSNPTNDSLDVSGRSDQTLTLASGQTLAGVGGVGGNLVVSAGAIISPAGTNVTLGITEGSNSTGTIAVSNAVTLNGTTVIKLDGSGINDEVQAGAGITYGGTLNLVNISGSPLANGNSFNIFSANTYSGSFANITPATPGAGLAWDTSQLNTGFISVVVTSQPVINSTMVSGGNLIFSGTNGVANGNYSVWTTTNLATPFTNWLTLLTNTFDAMGSFSVTNPISLGSPQQFYRIQSP
jgi:autotransporter-associated beta strand protein